MTKTVINGDPRIKKTVIPSFLTDILANILLSPHVLVLFHSYKASEAKYGELVKYLSCSTL